jgi:DMSO/TMAO reductase YedYZ molybdopterin-dependent catalytic subunit
LAAVLERIDAPLGQRLRGPALRSYVVVRAADGYAVVLSLAEVDPAMRQSTIIVADRADGQPLPADDGPFRLVVEGDTRPARSVRQVTAIEVRTP